MGIDPDLPERTQTTYQEHGPNFDRQRGRQLMERAWLERFLALAPDDGPILDIGCGAGEPIARYLIEQGRTVTGVDFAPSLLDISKARFPEQTWISSDMRSLDLGRKFAGIIAWDSFFHLTRDDQHQMFAVFARHLMPGGALMFTSGDYDGEVTGHVDGQLVYHASLSPSRYAGCLENNGFRVRRFVAEDGECGFHSVWLARFLGSLTD